MLGNVESTVSSLSLLQNSVQAREYEIHPLPFGHRAAHVAPPGQVTDRFRVQGVTDVRRFAGFYAETLPTIQNPCRKF